MKYKKDLERHLTNILRTKEPVLSRVTISEDGQYAILQVAGNYARRRLSALAKEYLRTGDVVLTESESFLEPE